MRRQPSKRQLRCFCSRKPLLAIWGNDENGDPYVHVRIYKQDRIFGDIVIQGGSVKICCRECVRWHRIRFVESRNSAELIETTTPDEVDRTNRILDAELDEG